MKEIRETAETAKNPEAKPEDKKKAATALAQGQKAAAELTAKFPESPKVQDAGAQLALQAGDYKTGLRRADKAVELARQKREPEALADALRTRALASWYTGDYPAAARDAEQAMKARPGDPVANSVYHLSRIRAKALRPKLEELLEYGSPLEDPRVRVAGRRASDHQQALKLLEQSMRQLSVGDAQGALGAAGAAQALDPAVPDIYMQRALAWMMLKDLSAAVRELNKAIELWARKGGAAASLASAYNTRSKLKGQAKDYQAAFADADQAVALNAKGAQGYFYRAKAREGLGEKGEALLADFKRAAELDPRSFAADYEKALARAEGDQAPPGPKAPSRPRRGLAAGAVLICVAAAAAWRSRKRRIPMPAAPNLAGKFKLGERIGSGGMGTVYRAWDTALERPVAIKRLNDPLKESPDETERFMSEARTVGGLKHPAIVAIYDVFKEAEELYLVFELVEGETVSQALQREAKLSRAECLRILRPVCEAVDYAHGKKIIHRDLKPSNIMLEQGRVKVMDFGIARRIKGQDRTMTEGIIGTPPYMAPELEQGEVSRESDTYALGVCAYEMLTGRRPFSGPRQQQDKLEGRPQPAPGLEAGTQWTAFLGQALHPDREKRYRTASELYGALLQALS